MFYVLPSSCLDEESKRRAMWNSFGWDVEVSKNDPQLLVAGGDCVEVEWKISDNANLTSSYTTVFGKNSSLGILRLLIQRALCLWIPKFDISCLYTSPKMIIKNARGHDDIACQSVSGDYIALEFNSKRCIGVLTPGVEFKIQRHPFVCFWSDNPICLFDAGHRLLQKLELDQSLNLHKVR